MPSSTSPIHIDLDTPQAQEGAARLETFKREVVQERWLSTLVLSIHLEIEACLEVLLRSTSAALKPASRPRYASFSAKLSQCSALHLLEPNVIEAVKALNTLRNELAHRLDNKPTNASLFRFIAAMSAVHPLSVTDAAGLESRELRSVEAIEAHFTGEEAINFEDFIFVSMMLLRAGFLVRIKAVNE